MMKSVLFLLGCLLHTSVAVLMEFHIYSEENQKGESLRLTKTHTDLAYAVKLIGGLLAYMSYWNVRFRCGNRLKSLN